MCKWKQTMSLCTTKAIISHVQACTDFELRQRNTHVSSSVYSIYFLKELRVLLLFKKHTKTTLPYYAQEDSLKANISVILTKKKSMLLIQYNLVSFRISSDLYIRAVFKIWHSNAFEFSATYPNTNSLSQVMTTRGCYHLNCIFYGNYRSKTASLITY